MSICPYLMVVPHCRTEDGSGRRLRRAVNRCDGVISPSISLRVALPAASKLGVTNRGEARLYRKNLVDGFAHDELPASLEGMPWCMGERWRALARAGTRVGPDVVEGRSRCSPDGAPMRDELSGWRFLPQCWRSSRPEWHRPARPRQRVAWVMRPPACLHRVPPAKPPEGCRTFCPSCAASSASSPAYTRALMGPATRRSARRSNDVLWKDGPGEAVIGISGYRRAGADGATRRR